MFSHSLDALNNEVNQNYWTIWSLSDEMYWWTSGIQPMYQQLYTVQGFISDMQATITQLNQTNQIWIHNFKIMENAFEQLKKKHKILS